MDSLEAAGAKVPIYKGIQTVSTSSKLLHGFYGLSPGSRVGVTIHRTGFEPDVDVITSNLIGGDSRVPINVAILRHSSEELEV
jgi:hypothetical protein